MSKRTRALQIEAKRSASGYISLGDGHIVVAGSFVRVRSGLESHILSVRINDNRPLLVGRSERRRYMQVSRDWREACALSRPRLP